MAERYLQHVRDWTMTRDAIVRLSARFEHPFTYAELAAEIAKHDGLKIDPRGYAGALDAVAGSLGSTDPLWTIMVVNAETREPGYGFWQASYADLRYRMADTLSPEGRAAWLEDQQRWCIAAAKVALEPLDQRLRDEERALRERAHDSLLEQMRLDQQGRNEP